MFCQKCGAKNEDDARFCKSCGINLVEGAKEAAVVPGIMPDKYAGFWMRVVSSFIDSIALFIIYFISANSVGIISVILFGKQPDFPILKNNIFLVVAMFLSIFYEIWMHVRFGQTFGKMATGIKVVTTRNGYVTYKLAFLRWLGKLINCLILGIGFIMAAFHKEKRGLHDLMANTKVVYVQKK